jgi:hypothetical protein
MGKADLQISSLEGRLVPKGDLQKIEVAAIFGQQQTLIY